jgi:hypothetical protein
MTGRLAARFDSIGTFDPFVAGPLDAFLQVGR